MSTSTIATADFLALWNAHEDLRSSGASIAELYASSQRLNAARQIIRRQL